MFKEALLKFCMDNRFTVVGFLCASAAKNEKFRHDLELEQLPVDSAEYAVHLLENEFCQTL